MKYYNSLPWNNPHAYGTMVLTEEYKLVAYHGIDDGELYNFTKDPTETYNLWDHEDYKNIKLNVPDIIRSYGLDGGSAAFAPVALVILFRFYRLLTLKFL